MFTLPSAPFLSVSSFWVSAKNVNFKANNRYLELISVSSKSKILESKVLIIQASIKASVNETAFQMYVSKIKKTLNNTFL